MSRIIGVDPGTMNFQTAEVTSDKKIEIKTIRSAFVEINATEDIEDILNQNKWHFVKDEEHYYVIGEDALKVARMFPSKVELRRPMAGGVLNKRESKKMLIMAELINSSVGDAPDNNSMVCTCVSSDSVDGSVNSSFHKARLVSMIERKGWNVKVIEEGLAIVLSEKPIVVEPDGTESPFSGIGISFGAGRSNCVLVYKGLPVIGMSVARGGDFIDQQVSEQTDTDISQVIAKKEKYLDFNNLDIDDDVIFALDVYYGELIKYVIKHFSAKFMEVKSEFPAPPSIVVAGGTSLPNGFTTKLEKVIERLELPFEISGIKLASDPRNAVVKGCLRQAAVSQRKLVKSSEGKTNKKKEKKGEEENSEELAS